MKKPTSTSYSSYDEKYVLEVGNKKLKGIKLLFLLLGIGSFVSTIYIDIEYYYGSLDGFNNGMVITYNLLFLGFAIFAIPYSLFIVKRRDPLKTGCMKIESLLKARFRLNERERRKNHQFSYSGAKPEFTFSGKELYEILTKDKPQPVKTKKFFKNKKSTKDDKINVDNNDLDDNADNE